LHQRPTFALLVLLALAGMSTGLLPSRAFAQAHEHDDGVLCDEADSGGTGINADLDVDGDPFNSAASESGAVYVFR
jgi:hypothetical protein